MSSSLLAFYLDFMCLLYNDQGCFWCYNIIFFDFLLTSFLFCREETNKEEDEALFEEELAEELLERR